MIEHFKPMPHFKRDVKALSKKHLPIQNIQRAVHYIIVEDYNTLIKSYDDHALSGNLRGYRDLHVKGFKDLVLLYKVVKSRSLLKLTRVGSHDQLFK